MYIDVHIVEMLTDRNIVQEKKKLNLKKNKSFTFFIIITIVKKKTLDHEENHRC